MQSIQIESGSMYNTTSKRLNYKQLDPIDAQAPKKGRSRGSLAAEQHEGRSLGMHLPISEARAARAVWVNGNCRVGEAEPREKAPSAYHCHCSVLVALRCRPTASCVRAADDGAQARAGGVGWRVPIVGGASQRPGPAGGRVVVQGAGCGGRMG